MLHDKQHCAAVIYAQLKFLREMMTFVLPWKELRFSFVVHKCMLLCYLGFVLEFVLGQISSEY